MGDTACLMQPFCYAAGISNEANQSIPIHALGQSISFGRFMSESLAWEKWSTFSHNRYVEEAERYSRPGSVAQKKAFFEAHYKKLAAQKAAALLEQANNAASSNVAEQEHEAVVDNNQNSQTSPNSKFLVREKQDFKILNSQPDILSSNGRHSNLNIDASMSESNKLEEAEPEIEHQPFVGNSMKVELQSQLEDVDTHMEVSEKVSGTPLMHKPILKSSNSDQEVLSSVSKKKPPFSPLKLLKTTGTSKFTTTPVKSTVSTSSKTDNFVTSTSKKPGLSSAEKKRSPVNFTPIRELNRLTASVMSKFQSTRVGAGFSKASKDSSTPLRTPTMASKNECKMHSLMTPSTEKKRTKTPIDSSASGSNALGPKWRLFSAEKNMRSPIISSPFCLRTEERASTRKKKLEEKFNNHETQKMQLHTKLKEKAETEIRKLRQSFCFKARPLPDFYKERKASKEETKKDRLTQRESPKQLRKPIPSVVESKTPLPPQKPSVKNNGINGRTSTHPLTANSTINNMRIHRQIFSMETKMTDITNNFAERAAGYH